jgi:hypothetical protein
VEAKKVPADHLRIGHTLPAGSTVRSVRLDGRRVDYDARETNRGLEVTVAARPGDHEVVVTAG